MLQAVNQIKHYLEPTSVPQAMVSSTMRNSVKEIASCW